MAVAVANPFELTATGILGDKRETMLQNQLLLRDELGRSRSRAYVNYPGLVFRYGKTNLMNPGGAMQAISGWSGSNGPSSNRASGERAMSVERPRTERDFITTNRKAAEAGVTTSAESSRFRANHNFRRSILVERGGSPTAPSRRLPPSMVFGISTRPATPISDLLEHRYQDQWVQQRRNELAKSMDNAPKKVSLNKVHENRASQLRSFQIPVEPTPYWQMPRFAKTARPHLETFRNPGEKDRAFQYHETDGAARQGRFNFGVYHSAKS